MQTKHDCVFLFGGVILAVAKFAHQKSKPVILLSQVKLQEMFAIDPIRDRHELFRPEPWL